MILFLNKLKAKVLLLLHICMGIALSILDISENSSAVSYDYNCHSINVYIGINIVKKK